MAVGDLRDDSVDGDSGWGTRARSALPCTGTRSTRRFGTAIAAALKVDEITVRAIRMCAGGCGHEAIGRRAARSDMPVAVGGRATDAAAVRIQRSACEVLLCNRKQHAELGKRHERRIDRRNSDRAICFVSEEDEWRIQRHHEPVHAGLHPSGECVLCRACLHQHLYRAERARR